MQKISDINALEVQIHSTHWEQWIVLMNSRVELKIEIQIMVKYEVDLF